MNSRRIASILASLLSCSWSLAAAEWAGFAPVTTEAEIFPNSVLESVADFSGDGHLDILARSGAGDLGMVLLGDGRGHFSAGPIFFSGVLFLVEGANAERGFAVSDFNRDGLADYAVAGIVGPGFPELERVRVGLGRGDGTFGGRGIWEGLGYLHGVATGDFNQDNMEDLAVNMGSAAPGAPQGILVFLGRGDGTFDPPLLSSATTIGRGGPVVADFTGDLVQDLLLKASSFNLLAGDGQGGFAALASVALGGPSLLIEAELNGDEAPDLLTGSYSAVSVLLGHGDGSFDPAQPYNASHGPAALATGDFDLDGSRDIAAAFAPNLGFAVWLGYGNGSFIPERRFEGGGRSVAVGDFDGRNGPDVVTLQIGSSSAQVLIHRNLGTVNCDTLNCNDGNNCTDDSCDPVLGCVLVTNHLCDAQPKGLGYWKRLCNGPVEGEELTSFDVDCVSNSCTFARVASVADICDRLNANPENDKCEKGEAELMALELNFCRLRVAESQSADAKKCTIQDTVGGIRTEADSLLCSPVRYDITCETARCESYRVNEGKAF